MERQEGGSKAEASLSEALQQRAREEMDELVKFELDLEDLAVREASLLNAYLAEDAQAVKLFWQALKQELLQQAEYRAEDFLARVASPSVIDWLRLDYRIHRADSQLLAGERAENLQLNCANCENSFQVSEPIEIEACHNCDSEVFNVQPLLTVQ